jgi:hypothetical protein
MKTIALAALLALAACAGSSDGGHSPDCDGADSRTEYNDQETGWHTLRCTWFCLNDGATVHGLEQFYELHDGVWEFTREDVIGACRFPE